MPIEKEIEVCSCSYKDVTITNAEIIRDLEQKDAFEVIEGLLKKYPSLTDRIFKERDKIFPRSKEIRDKIARKYAKTHMSLLKY